MLHVIEVYILKNMIIVVLLKGTYR